MLDFIQKFPRRINFSDRQGQQWQGHKHTWSVLRGEQNVNPEKPSSLFDANGTFYTYLGYIPNKAYEENQTIYAFKQDLFRVQILTQRQFMQRFTAIA